MIGLEKGGLDICYRWLYVIRAFDGGPQLETFRATLGSTPPCEERTEYWYTHGVLVK
jgi:hypothetical protein